MHRKLLEYEKAILKIFGGSMNCKIELRPCYVDGTKALFHGWGKNKRIVEPSPMSGGGPGGTAAQILGIVEFSYGTVKQVFPERIKFTDHLFDAYYWED